VILIQHVSPNVFRFEPYLHTSLRRHTFFGDLFYADKPSFVRSPLAMCVLLKPFGCMSTLVHLGPPWSTSVHLGPPWSTFVKNQPCLEAGLSYSEAGLSYSEAGLSYSEAGLSYSEAGLYYREAGLYYPEPGASIS
jgi:hypothetical protein